MRFDDLTPYVYGPPDWRGPRTVNIGWLGDSVDFAVGDPLPVVLDRIAALCRKPVNLMRGAHVCGLCGLDPARTQPTGGQRISGNGEIRVEAGDGTIYAAPAMILHYVRDHRYAPPAAFVQALVEVCPMCGNRLSTRIEGRTQGLYCETCKQWDCVTTYFPPFLRDDTFHTMIVTRFDEGNLAHIRACATLTAENYLQAKKRLAAAPVLRFKAKAPDILAALAIAERVGLGYALKPHFPYTRAHAKEAGVPLVWDARRVLFEHDEPRLAPSTAGGALETPEDYKGLPRRAREARALYVARRSALLVSSAYALFDDPAGWWLRRVEHGPDGPGSPSRSSFGAEVRVEAAFAQAAIETARLCRPARPTEPPKMIDGPDMFEIDLDGRLCRYAEDNPSAASQSARLAELIAQFDRVLPASTLRERLEKQSPPGRLGPPGG